MTEAERKQWERTFSVSNISDERESLPGTPLMKNTSTGEVLANGFGWMSEEKCKRLLDAIKRELDR